VRCFNNKKGRPPTAIGDRLDSSEPTVMNSEARTVTISSGAEQAPPTSVAIVPMPCTNIGYLDLNPHWVDPALGAVDLALAKQIVIIPDLWNYFGLDGIPGPSCRSPFRRDRSPSFSIYAEGRRFRDFGLGIDGDQLDFLCMARPVMDWWMARDFLIAMATHKIELGTAVPVPLPPSAFNFDAVSTKPQLPESRKGTDTEIAKLAALRGLSRGGLRHASDIGILRFGTCCGHRCWFVSDDSGWCMEARRLDGEYFPAIPGGLPARKAHTLKGSSKSWPVGAANIGGSDVNVVIVAEGGPDLLAACDLTFRLRRSDCRAVGMLGRGVGGRLHSQGTPLFAGKRVRIVPHNDGDGGGIAAAISWGQQLIAVGADVDTVDIRKLVSAGEAAIKDLNDLVKLCGDRIELLAPLIP